MTRTHVTIELSSAMKTLRGCSYVDKSDSATSRIMSRICSPRASFSSRLILRAAVRSAIDQCCSMDQEMDVECLLEDAFSMVVRNKV